MAALKMCRVCLVSDCTMYRVSNTVLEETYERVTREKLYKVDRPATLCFICVSQLRKCLKFTQTALQANEMLDQWYKNTSRTDNVDFPVRSLVSLIRTSPETTNFISNDIYEIKKEITTDTSDNEGSFHTKENMKCIFIRDYDDENDNTHVSDEVNTQMANKKNNKTYQSYYKEFDTFESKTLIDVNDIKQQMSDEENDNTLLSESIKYEIIQIQDYANTVPSTLNIDYDESNCESDNDYVSEQTSKKTTTLSRDTKGKTAFTTAEKTKRDREKLKQKSVKCEQKKKQFFELNLQKRINDLTEEENEIRRKKWKDTKMKQKIKKNEREIKQELRKIKQTITPAERAKKYREKLKQNPEKFEEQRLKHLERLKNSRKTIDDLTEEEKEIRRKQWRKEKEKQKNKKKGTEVKEIKIKPKTPGSERGKKYREKLKQNPEKYEELRMRHLLRLRNTRKKINDFTEEEKEIRRKQWREEKKQQKMKKKLKVNEGQNVTSINRDLLM